MGIFALPATLEKIFCVVFFCTFIGFFAAMHMNVSDTRIQFHEMIGYKDALLVQFMHLPALVVENSKGEPENFIFDAEKLTASLTNTPDKYVPEYDIGNTSYHIHVIDTQTGKYWDFKNNIPVDVSFNIPIDEKNRIWRYANILYPDGTISTVLVRAVYVVGKEGNRYKKKEWMKCNSDGDCAEGLYCTNGTTGQMYKTCQSTSICTYSKSAGDDAQSVCECISQEISGGTCLGATVPAKLIKGQPCIANSACESNDCNKDGLPSPISNYPYPSEYYTCN